MKLSVKDIFSFRLYVEGLKKIRLVGVAAAITVITLNALMPILDIVGAFGRFSSQKTLLSYMTFIPFGLLMMLFGVIMAHSMFSYLNERRDSDFYHAIPQKRSCVYISFLAAILTWIFGILIASSLVNAALWGIAPHYIYSFSSVILSVLFLFLTAAMVTAFMTLAMMLTGTSIANWLIYLLLFLFVRTVGGIFVSCLSGLLPILDLEYSFWKILAPTFFLPYVSMVATFEGNLRAVTTGLIFYSVLVTLLLYVLAGLAYAKRRSEIATRSASNRILQHAYRCAVTLPFMLLGAYVMIDGNDFDMGTAITFLIIAFVVYALYELLTTKKLKNLWRSLPLFLVPIVLTGMFAMTVYGTRNAVLDDPIEADEIESVGFYSTLNLDKSYNQLLTERLATDDDNAKKLVADVLAYAGEAIREGTYGTVRYYGVGVSTTSRNILIHLKSGRTVGRRIRMREADAELLEQYLMSSGEFREANLALPTEKSIAAIFFTGNHNDDMTDRMWATFVAEYMSLDEDDQYALRKYSNSEALTVMTVQGVYERQTYVSYFSITAEYTPKTVALYLESLYNDTKYRATMRKFRDVYQVAVSDTFEGTAHGQLNLYLQENTAYINFDTDFNDADTKEQIKELLGLLDGAVFAKRPFEEGTPVRFYCWFDVYDDTRSQYFESDLYAVLTDEEYAKMTELKKAIESSYEKVE